MKSIYFSFVFHPIYFCHCPFLITGDIYIENKNPFFFFFWISVRSCGCCIVSSHHTSYLSHSRISFSHVWFPLRSVWRRLDVKKAAVIQLLCPVWLLATPWTAAHLASLSFTVYESGRWIETGYVYVCEGGHGVRGWRLVGGHEYHLWNCFRSKRKLKEFQREFEKSDSSKVILKEVSETSRPVTNTEED